MDGANIRSLRKQMGLTQEEFAHEVGVTFATVNRWENGKSEPSRLALKMLMSLNHRSGAAARNSRSKTGRRSAR